MLRIQTVVYLFVRPILNKCGAKSATTQSVYTSNVALQTHAEHYVPFPNSGASHTGAVPKNETMHGSVLCVNGTPTATRSGMQRYGCNDTDTDRSVPYHFPLCQYH